MKTMANAVLILAAGLASTASAADRVFALGEYAGSSDSAGFDTRSVGIGAGYYTSPDSFADKLAYRHRRLDYSGPGFATDGSADSLLASKNLGPVQADAEITRARVGSFGKRTLGAFQLAGQLPWAVNIEGRFEKDLVESTPSLKQGITYSAWTLAADKEITPRFVLSGVAGRLDFSDDNKRDLYRLKANYVVAEDLGLSVYAKARHYADSRPGGGLYFSPDSFNDYLGGLRIRRRVGALGGMLSAYLEAGRQKANGVGMPARGWQVQMESFPNKPWHYNLTIGAQSSNEAGSGQANADSHYQYKYARASAIYAFF